MSGLNHASTITLGKKISFSIVSTFLFLFLLESFLRVIHFSYESNRSMRFGQQIDQKEQAMQSDPELPWSWLPIPKATRIISIPRLNYSFEIRFNDKGFRGPSFQVRKPPGIVRIVSMGDSCTMGWGVDEDKAYCYRLGEILKNQSTRKTEVINAGVLGFTSFQGLHLLRVKILKWQPDILIISYNWNDHLPALGMGSETSSMKPTPDKYLPKRSLSASLLLNFSYLRILQLVNYVLDRTDKFSGATQKRKPVEGNNGIVVRVDLPDFSRNLEEMIAIARSRKIIPVLMTEPGRTLPEVLPPRLGGNDRIYLELQSKYNDAIRKVAAKNHVMCIDLIPVFAGYPSSMIFLDLVHEKAKGQALVAQELAPKILTLVESR